MVKKLMTINCYDGEKTMIIMGTCLPSMQPNAYKKLEEISTSIYELCLEETHVNMAITKIIGILSRIKVERLIFATVDKSPHCVQMHYIESEIIKAMKLENTKIIHYIATNDELVEISSDTIKLSKNLTELEKIKR